jgi:hypothetical protein
MKNQYTVFKGSKKELIDYFNGLISLDKNKPLSYSEIDSAPIIGQIEESISRNKFNNGTSTHSFGIVFLLYRNETSLSVERFYIHVTEETPNEMA